MGDEPASSGMHARTPVPARARGAGSAGRGGGSAGAFAWGQALPDRVRVDAKQSARRGGAGPSVGAPREGVASGVGLLALPRWPVPCVNREGQQAALVRQPDLYFSLGRCSLQLKHDLQLLRGFEI